MCACRKFSFVQYKVKRYEELGLGSYGPHLQMLLDSEWKSPLQGTAQIEFNAWVMDFAGRPCLLAGFSPYNYYQPLQCVCQGFPTPELMVTSSLLSISLPSPVPFRVFHESSQESVQSILSDIKYSSMSLNVTQCLKSSVPPTFGQLPLFRQQCLSQHIQGI